MYDDIFTYLRINGIEQYHFLNWNSAYTFTSPSKVIPISDDIPELNEASTSSGGRKPGPYKKFEDKGPRAQFSAVAAVHDQHEAGAILQAAPKAASVLGHAKLATAGWSI